MIVPKETWHIKLHADGFKFRNGWLSWFFYDSLTLPQNRELYLVPSLACRIGGFLR